MNLIVFCYCMMNAVLEEPEDPANRSFFSEIISSISDVQFSHNGRYLLTRDYLSLKVWDLNMDTKPVETYPVHEHLRSKLCALYENDCIFDKFECAWSGNDRYIMQLCYIVYMLHYNYDRIEIDILIMSVCNN